MPYPGVPDELTSKMESCIASVMKDGKSKSSAIAICKARIVPDKKDTERSAGDVNSRPVLSPIRYVGNDRYCCYAVTFNGPSDKDLYGTYFDDKTRYYLDFYDKRPWLYDHGLHPFVGRAKVGVWDAIGMDDGGVFVEGELDRHHKYKEKIETLIAEKVLYPSSGALNYLVRISDDGHVEDWPISEVTSTVRPADWRMLKSISPAAHRAVRMLLDEYITEVDAMNVEQLMQKFGIRSDDVAENEDVATDAETESENGSVDAEEQESETEQMSDDGESELRSIFEAIATELAAVRSAIVALDGALEEQSNMLQNHDRLLSGLAEDENERTYRAVSDGGWLDQLYVATRSDDSPDATDEELNQVSIGALPEGATGWELISGQSVQ